MRMLEFCHVTCIVQSQRQNEYYYMYVGKLVYNFSLAYLRMFWNVLEYLIEQEYRKFETTIMEIAETIPDGNEKELILKKLYELITLMRNCALQVLDYKLY